MPAKKKTTKTKSAPRKRVATKTARATKKKEAAPSKHRRTRANAAGRALWTGTLGFGLLQIPVSVHTATASDELGFHQLDKRDHAPVGYKRYNKSTGEEVEWGDIVKGYEIAKGEYVIVSDEELKAANVEATQSIDIVDFVQLGEVPPMYFDTPYYLAPQKRAAKAYAVLRDALAKKDRAALATVVLRTRQHMCVVFPRDNALMMQMLRYEHELRAPDALDLPAEQKVSAAELAMAEELIEKMTREFDMTRYHDQYREDVLDMIEEKSKTGKFEIPKGLDKAPSGNVVDLVAMLKKSLDRDPDELRGEHVKKSGRRKRSA